MYIREMYVLHVGARRERERVAIYIYIYGARDVCCPHFR